MHIPPSDGQHILKKHEGVPLAPHLRQFHWDRLDGARYESEEGALEELIMSRWWMDAQEGVTAAPRCVARLEKVYVSRYSGDSMSERLVARRRDVKEEGLDLL